MEARKVYQLILIFLLNVILLISRDWERTIYLCAAINILFWWNNRRYLKYSVEKWNLQNLIISLFKLSTIIYFIFIFIFRFLIDFNTMEGLLLVGTLLSSELLLFLIVLFLDGFYISFL